jgi:hypothetical protein
MDLEHPKQSHGPRNDILKVEGPTPCAPCSISIVIGNVPVHYYETTKLLY